MIRLTYIGEQLIGFEKGEDCPLSVKMRNDEADWMADAGWTLVCLKKSKNPSLANVCDFDNCPHCQRARTFREVQGDFDGMMDEYDNEE